MSSVLTPSTQLKNVQGFHLRDRHISVAEALWGKVLMALFQSGFGVFPRFNRLSCFHVLTEREETSSSVCSVELHVASVINQTRCMIVALNCRRDHCLLTVFFKCMPFWSNAVVSIYRLCSLCQLTSVFGCSEAETVPCLSH